jgi:hypothetical protein
MNFEMGCDAVGSWDEAGTARRSFHFGNCRTSWKDAGTGVAGMGNAARYGFADNTHNCGSRAGKL